MEFVQRLSHARSALMVLTLFAGCGDAGESGDDGGTNAGSGNSAGGDSDDPHQQCVDRINELRATLSLPPLARWTDAEDCSDSQSAADNASKVAHGNFGDCEEFAQNTCPSWPNVSNIVSGCLDQMWAEGEPPAGPCDGPCFQMHGHYITMSSKSYTKVACGFHDDGKGSVWSNQNFK